MAFWSGEESREPFPQDSKMSMPGLPEGPCRLSPDPVSSWHLPSLGRPGSLPPSSNFFWAWRTLCQPFSHHVVLKCHPNSWRGTPGPQDTSAAPRATLWQLGHPRTVCWYLSSHSGRHFGKILCIEIYRCIDVYIYTHIYACICNLVDKC